MWKILIGSIFVFIAFIDYCCCRVAGLEDRRMEELLPTDRREAK